MDRALIVIKGLIALVAVLSPYFALAAIVTLPDAVNKLAGILTGAANLFVAILVIINSKPIKRLATRMISISILVIFILGVIASIAYVQYADKRVQHIDFNGVTYIIPATPSNEILSMVSHYRHNYSEAILNHPRGEELLRLIDEENNGETTILLLLLIAAETLVLSSLLIGIWRII